VGLLIVLLAPFIANHWIHAAGMPLAQVRNAVMAMGLLLFFQWLVTFHQAGLIGLHRQVFVNVVKIVAVSLSSGGALVVLWLVSRSATSLFLWQAGIAALQGSVLVVWLWHTMPAADGKPRLNFELLRGVWRFAAGMSGISISAIVLTQLDKLILSRICSLEVFGYYVLAGMFGRALLMLSTPVFDAIFPRFSALVAAGDERSLAQLYHRCSQVMAVLIVPLAAVCAMFSANILLIWTRNPDVARNAATIASVLSVGAAINALMVLPYTLQLANGWTSIGLKMNLSLMVTLVPVIWILTMRYGGIGAAAAYLAFMCTYMAMGVALTHRRLLKGATSTWFVRDVGLPAAAVLLVAGFGRLLYSHPTAQITAVAGLCLVLLATVMAAAFAAPLVREWVVAELSKIRLAYV
jgi:O-antigen/teichoic acid export membrane protein